jgi:hypothetical protein
VDPRAGLDAVAKRKKPCPCQALSPSHPLYSIVSILTELSHFFAVYVLPSKKPFLTPIEKAVLYILIFGILENRLDIKFTY